MWQDVRKTHGYWHAWQRELDLSQPRKEAISFLSILGKISFLYWLKCGFFLLTKYKCNEKHFLHQWISKFIQFEWEWQCFWFSDNVPDNKSRHNSKNMEPSCIKCTQTFNMEIKVFITLETMHYTSKKRKATIKHYFCLLMKSWHAREFMLVRIRT